MIYLDNSATTKPYPDVLKSFNQVSTELFANPSSIHQLGGQVESLLLKAHQQVAQLLDVEVGEVLFTSGGTEGNNLAIKGIALEHQTRGKHIITTEVEHPSVYDTCKSLERLGFEITYLPVNKDGVVSVSDVENAIRRDTILITVMHVNNEIGSVQPIKEIGNIAKRYPKLYFHVDDVQGLGKVSLDLKQAGVDLCTMSAHKIHGLKGTGILYVKKGTMFFPLFHGGSQENKLRPGTENVAGIVALVKALRLSLENMNEYMEDIRELNNYLRDQLEAIDSVIINTPENGAPHVMNFSIIGLKPEVMIHALGQQEIFISTKSACSSKQNTASRTILACGHGVERASTALRISMTYDTTKEDIMTFIDVLTKQIKTLKVVME